MAHLTDAQHKTVGHTVLYIPDEGPSMDLPDAFKDKELVLRLEGMALSMFPVVHLCFHLLSFLHWWYFFVGCMADGPYVGCMADGPM